MPNASESKLRLPAFPVIALLIAVGWLLAGALYKLLEGSPNDLPPMVQDAAQRMFSMDMVATFRTAITVELIVVALALVRPRVGWLVIAAQYCVFIGILAWMQLLGAEKCGCFGSKINIKPLEMLAIDGPILLLLLASRPWRIRTGFSAQAWGAVLLFAGVAWWLPHWKITTDIAPPVGGAGEQVAGGNEGPPDGAGNGGAGAGGAEDTGAPVNPLAGVDFVQLKPHDWAGKVIYDTELATTLLVGGADDLPFPAHVILYRKSCEHCRDHLNKLATESPITDKGLVLVLIPEDASMPNVIEMLPEGHLHKELWPTKRGYGLATPWAFDISDLAEVTGVVDLREAEDH
jgi:hypothetical protein